MSLEMSDLVGKIFCRVERESKRYENDAIRFVEDHTNNVYILTHSQGCCETVNIEDIAGDLQDLVGVPILTAERRTNSDDPPSTKESYEPDSYTWTFFRIGTIKGSVVIRFFGSSNGYYGEDADLYKVD